MGGEDRRVDSVGGGGEGRCINRDSCSFLLFSRFCSGEPYLELCAQLGWRSSFSFHSCLVTARLFIYFIHPTPVFSRVHSSLCRPQQEMETNLSPASTATKER